MDDRSCRSQEVHSDDSPEFEAIVHLADLDLESVQTVIADREPIDLPQEDVLVTSDASEPAKPVVRREIDPCIGS